jgi:hypothetical protein
VRADANDVECISPEEYTEHMSSTQEFFQTTCRPAAPTTPHPRRLCYAGPIPRASTPRRPFGRCIQDHSVQKITPTILDALQAGIGWTQPRFEKKEDERTPSWFLAAPTRPAGARTRRGAANTRGTPRPASGRLTTSSCSLAALRRGSELVAVQMNDLRREMQAVYPDQAKPWRAGKGFRGLREPGQLKAG